MTDTKTEDKPNQKEVSMNNLVKYYVMAGGENIPISGIIEKKGSKDLVLIPSKYLVEIPSQKRGILENFINVVTAEQSIEDYKLANGLNINKPTPKELRELLDRLEDDFWELINEVVEEEFEKWLDHINESGCDSISGFLNKSEEVGLL